MHIDSGSLSSRLHVFETYSDGNDCKMREYASLFTLVFKAYPQTTLPLDVIDRKNFKCAEFEIEKSDRCLANLSCL